MEKEDVTQIIEAFREVIVPEISASLNERIDRLDRDNKAHFDALYGRIERVETELTMMTAGLKRLEDRVDRLECRMSRMEAKLEELAEIADIKTQIAALEQRLAALEARH